MDDVLILTMRQNHLVTNLKVHSETGKLSVLLAVICLLILGSSIISSGYNFANSGDSPVIAQSPMILLHITERVTLLKFPNKSIILPSVDALSFLNRAPPI
jgi:hypothetical protein